VKAIQQLVTLSPPTVLSMRDDDFANETPVHGLVRNRTISDSNMHLILDCLLEHSNDFLCVRDIRGFAPFQAAATENACVSVINRLLPEAPLAVNISAVAAREHEEDVIVLLKRKRQNC